MHMYVLWPGIRQDIEAKVLCRMPEAEAHTFLGPPVAMEWPTRPWNGLPGHGQIDFAGESHVHSKWMEVHMMSSITATATIQCLCGISAPA